MRNAMITALKNHYHGEIGKHKMNVEVFLPPEGKVLDRLGRFVNELKCMQTS